ncbi:MAG: cytochrome c oxidase subunit 3 [Hymenobacter sp.]
MHALGRPGGGPHVLRRQADANPVGSFVYVLMGVHAFHLLCGAVFSWQWCCASRYSIRCIPRRYCSIGSATLYWHFLGGLWLYLYLFLLLNH